MDQLEAEKRRLQTKLDESEAARTAMIVTARTAVNAGDVFASGIAQQRSNALDTNTSTGLIDPSPTTATAAGEITFEHQSSSSFSTSASSLTSGIGSGSERHTSTTSSTTNAD